VEVGGQRRVTERDLNPSHGMWRERSEALETGHLALAVGQVERRIAEERPLGRTPEDRRYEGVLALGHRATIRARVVGEPFASAGRGRELAIDVGELTHPVANAPEIVLGIDRAGLGQVAGAALIPVDPDLPDDSVQQPPLLAEAP
jgi:hypothetical protein